jgi:hypothetical protein
VVCESSKSSTCVLERSTPDRPRYSSFALHLWGPNPTTFSGSFVIGYFDDPDPTRYKNTVNLVSPGADVHQRVFSKIAEVPGEYSVRLQLKESGPGGPPRAHDLRVPVVVR